MSGNPSRPEPVSRLICFIRNCVGVETPISMRIADRNPWRTGFAIGPGRARIVAETASFSTTPDVVMEAGPAWRFASRPAAPSKVCRHCRWRPCPIPLGVSAGPCGPTVEARFFCDRRLKTPLFTPAVFWRPRSTANRPWLSTNACPWTAFARTWSVPCCRSGCRAPAGCFADRRRRLIPVSARARLQGGEQFGDPDDAT